MPKTTNKNTRPPIIAIMGHVDHGKTTLLDSLRQTRLVDKEAGGITQHIGAYQVKHQGETITFIDTPGHAAFSQMRARGANLTDIAILVVAANDGIKPQTIESIKHIKFADVPVIVAINKTDLPDASPDMVKAQLTEHEIFCEGYGGQVPAVNISALKSENLDELLETITLLSQMQELKSDPEGKLEAIVVETNQDKTKGTLAVAIVKNGTIKISDTIYAYQQPIRVRALHDEFGKPITQADPGMPVEIMGLKTAPDVGTTLTSKPTDPPVIIPEEPEPTPEETPEEKPEEEPEAKDQAETDQDADEIQEVPEAQIEPLAPQEINLILKADTQGSLEAITTNLTQELRILKSDTGQITTSDVLFANSTNSIIIGFNALPTRSAKKLAAAEGVIIKTFTIIYELLELLEKKVLKLIEPTIDEEELGLAKVLELFNINDDVIAGCKITSGQITKKSLAKLIRDDKTIISTHIKNLKKGKEDVDSVKSGTECGILLGKSVDIKKGDMIKSYKIKEDSI